MAFWVGTSFKMNKTVEEALAFARRLAETDDERDVRVQRFVIPSFTAVGEVKRALADTSVKVGAQNMHWEDAGAWTGEISPLMLKDCELDIVELGHSERREHFGETDRNRRPQGFGRYPSRSHSLDLHRRDIAGTPARPSRCCPAAAGRESSGGRGQRSRPRSDPARLRTRLGDRRQWYSGKSRLRLGAARKDRRIGQIHSRTLGAGPLRRKRQSAKLRGTDQPGAHRAGCSSAARLGPSTVTSTFLAALLRRSNADFHA